MSGLTLARDFDERSHSRQGLTMQDVKFAGVSLGAPAVAAFTQGRVDAAVLTGSAVTMVQRKFPLTWQQLRVRAAYVEIWSEGQLMARHERCNQRRQQILDLEHYLEPLSRKPGALAGSTALMQWRQLPARS